jgi:hypothetical protein
MTTFTKFIQDAAGKKAVDPDFLDRFNRAGCPRIDSLNALKKWARERWPEENPSDYRKSDPNAPHGREGLGLIWSKYLDWAEAAPAPKPAKVA